LKGKIADMREKAEAAKAKKNYFETKALMEGKFIITEESVSPL
jgi:hypothetical protein